MAAETTKPGLLMEHADGGRRAAAGCGCYRRDSSTDPKTNEHDRTGDDDDGTDSMIDPQRRTASIRRPVARCATGTIDGLETTMTTRSVGCAREVLVWSSESNGGVSDGWIRRARQSETFEWRGALRPGRS